MTSNADYKCYSEMCNHGNSMHLFLKIISTTLPYVWTRTVAFLLIVISFLITVTATLIYTSHYTYAFSNTVAASRARNDIFKRIPKKKKKDLASFTKALRSPVAVN